MQSQYARGPYNAPDDYWGTPGDKMLSYFSKQYNYIPNSVLRSGK